MCQILRYCTWNGKRVINHGALATITCQRVIPAAVSPHGDSLASDSGTDPCTDPCSECTGAEAQRAKIWVDYWI